MDTKLKSSKLYWVIFLVTIITFSFGMITLSSALQQNYFNMDVDETTRAWRRVSGKGDYFESGSYNGLIEISFSIVNELYNNNNDLLKIQNDNWDEVTYYKSEIDNLYQDYIWNNDLDTDVREFKYDSEGAIIRDPELFEMFSRDKASEIEFTKNRILNDLENRQEYLKKQAKQIGLNFEIKDGDTLISQHPENYNLTKNKLYIVKEGNIYKMSEILDREYSENVNRSNSYMDSNMDFTISIDDKVLDEIIGKWEASKELYEESLMWTIILLSITLIGFLYLIFSSNGHHWSGLKHLWLEFRLLIIAGILSINAASLLFYTDYLNDFINIIDDPFNKYYFPFYLWYLFWTFVGLSLVLSIFENIRDRELIKNTLLYKLVTMALELREGKVSQKFTIVILGFGVFLLITLFMIGVHLNEMGVLLLAIIFVIEAYIIKLMSGEIDQLIDGILMVKEGHLMDPIDVDEIKYFKSAAENINSIGEGLEMALEDELKASRHRNELITNVSHDLRTPLTSIITYIDLLKTEKDEDKIQEYIEVLDDKSHRLNTLVDTLFEASKVDSGDIPVNLVELNLLSLVNQGLAEKEDKFKELELEIILDDNLVNPMVKADGDLVWRALENIFSNIIKYSLENSRVYIDLYNKDQKAYLEIKNLSKYQLNISEEELLERFTRGDESRSSEGSGLGLSITKGLLDLQGGTFEIDIDGDLFKNIIILDLYKN